MFPMHRHAVQYEIFFFYFLHIIALHACTHTTHRFSLNSNKNKGNKQTLLFSAEITAVRMKSIRLKIYWLKRNEANI